MLLKRIFETILFALFISLVNGQNHFKIRNDIPHFPVIEPASITAPEHGMIIFSDTAHKPLIYTENGDSVAAIPARGVCWSTTISTPTLTANVTPNSTSTGNFSSTLTGLDAPVRAYTANAYGTSYGSYVPVTTKVITNLPTIPGDNSGIVFAGGQIMNDRGAGITEEDACGGTKNTTSTLADHVTSDGNAVMFVIS